MEWAEAVQMETEALRAELATTRAARDRMINSNLRLVISIAKRYTNRCAMLPCKLLFVYMIIRMSNVCKGRLLYGATVWHAFHYHSVSVCSC